MFKKIFLPLLLSIILLVIAGSCDRFSKNKFLIVTETTHFEIQGNDTTLNLPIFAGTLDIEKIVRDVTLAEYYYKKLSSVYSFKSFTFVENRSQESLLEQTGKLHAPLSVYSFEDSSYKMDLSLVALQNKTAQYAFRVTDKKTGQIRDHFVDVPDGKSASIGTMFEPQRNHGRIVSVSMQCIEINKSLTPDQLASFLRQKNSTRGSSAQAGFQPGDQRWMDEIFGPGKRTLQPETPPSNVATTSDEYAEYDSPPEVIGRIAISYPLSAKSDSISGQVLVKLFIDTSGVVSKCQVVKSLRPDMDSAAVQALRATAFKPAMMKGKKVVVWVTVPITFKLN